MRKFVKLAFISILLYRFLLCATLMISLITHRDEKMIKTIIITYILMIEVSKVNSPHSYIAAG